MLSGLKSIFDIDNVGNRWGVRILYLITVVLNAAVHFNPWADTDFTPLETWVMNLYNITDYDPDVVDALLLNIPLTKGNLIYILTLTIGELILLAAAFIYSATYVRDFRKAKIKAIKDNTPDVIDYAVSRVPDEPISTKKLIGRIVILMLFSLVVALPIVSITVYFTFFALIGLPFIYTAPVAYLSGDKGLFKSIPYSVKISRRYYFINMRSIALVFFVMILVDFTVPLLANVSLTAFYIVDAAVKTWLWLAFARLAGLSYCTMRDYPIKGGRRPFAI